jgi:hypothetical protein
MNGENLEPSAQPPARPAAEPEPAGQWQYKADNTPNASPYQPVGTATEQYEPASFESPELEWTASEFIAHSKGLMWYLAFAGVGLVIVALAYVVTRELIPTMLIATLGVIFGVAAGRKPRILLYSIGPTGIYVGDHFYPFTEYKAFSIVDEGAFSSIVFWPLQRFGFPVGLYYEPRYEAAIVQALANHLPMQEHKIDLLEQLMRKIRY